MSPSRKSSSARFDPDWCIHPGGTLRDWMEENGVPSARIVASCCRDLEERDVQGVLDGKRKITGPLAAKLQVATGIPAQLWLNLEKAFRQGLAEGKTWTR
jgi:plasmid maintenance system antidote protein VapI